MAVVEILVVATEVAREVVKVAVKVAVETDVVMVEVTGAVPVGVVLAGVVLAGVALDSDPVAVALEEVDQAVVVDLAVETAVVAAILH